MNETVFSARPVAAAVPASTPAATTSGELRAPLYIAWQVTNECNLACLHCIEESGPGRAFKDEMNEAQIFSFLRQVTDNDVPYMSFSGGEPMIHPLFFDMAAFVCARGVQLKVETNGHYLTRETCRRMADIGVKSVQVSLDGATPESYERMRPRGNFKTLIDGICNLTDAGLKLEINFSPTLFNAHEAADVVDLAYDMGAQSFYTGRTMYTGNAVKTWQKLTPNENQYAALFCMLHEKAAEYDGRMRVHFHEMGLLEELRYRLHNPAALLIVLPNGLVKLINALPFICGDLRVESLTEIWAHFQDAWRHPSVAGFVDQLAANPDTTSELHKWVFI
jgi:MoaA/NifB/PqqE/SkfB family radical SAM enzyme